MCWHLATSCYAPKKQGINPWTKEVFKGTKDYEQAIARADESELAA